ncbi:MAG: CxxxxCH/CxxCH domain-containing protein [Desulfuromonadaceae bacterium]
MKRPVAMSLALLLCSIVFTFNARAVVDPPHYDPAAGNTCATCHTVQLTLGSTGYNNICLNCHRPGDPAAGGKPITPADAANPFGIHSTTGISKMYQTSHRWDGSDTNPAAGAQPPVQPQMTTNSLRARTGSQLACVRCHNQHSNTYGSFLRMPNDQDQLCLDCHRSRNVQSHTQGSHPVGVPYSGSKTGFKVIPVNSSNPSADLNNYLKNGNVSCSTCHGVHFTDSRSSTIDGRANFANLSSGDGYILRTDRRGKHPGAGFDSANICSTCHAGKTSHNLKGQDVQCTDCHGAHVEYDPNDPTGAKGINIHLVKRVFPKGLSGSGRVFFRYTGSRKEYKNDQGTGICQGCHAVPAPGGLYPAEHASNDPKVCSTCHFHNSSNGSFSGACTACHGYPPTTAGHTRHAGSGAAGRLALTCSTCHGATTGNTHNNGSVNWDLTVLGSIAQYKTSAGTFATTGSTGTIAPSASYGQCTNLYCHSNVQGSGGLGAPGAYSQPTWGGAALTCGSCHKDMATDAGAPGSHVKHVQVLGLACTICHIGLGHNVASHADGTINLAFSGSASGTIYSKGTSFNPGTGYGSCTKSCHIKPVTWGSTLPADCTGCHGGNAASGAVLATGMHAKHINQVLQILSSNVACAACHNATVSLASDRIITTPANHANGTVNVVFAGGGTYANGTCSATYCHGTTLPASNPARTAPSWNTAVPTGTSVLGDGIAGGSNPGSGYCAQCHGYPPQNGHATAGCSGCHAHLNPDNLTFSNASLHINGVVDALSGSCDSCHGYPPARAGFTGTQNNWSSAKTENYPGGGGAHTINNHLSKTAKPADGFVQCSKCHNPADHRMSPAVFKPSQNIKVTVNQELRYEASKQTRYTSNRLDGSLHQTGRCSNISCHYGATPMWDQR